MKCQYCDSELVPGAKFCEACGSPVGNVPQPTASAEQPPAIPSISDYLKEEPAAPQPPVMPYTPAGVEPELQAKDPFQVPDSGDQPSGSVPPAPYGSVPYSVPEEKIMGLPAAQMGNIALGLGGVGCLLSFLGCGGLISILGLVAGFLSLKTAGRRNGIIGLVLSAGGLIIALAMICILLFITINSRGSSYNGY